MSRWRDRVGGGSHNGGATRSAAFQERCDKERVKLKTRLATQLQENMLDLLHDSQEADLIVVVPGEEIPVHRCILKLRLPELYDVMVQNNASSKVHLDFVDAEEVREILHYAYSEDDMTRCIYPDIGLSTIEDTVSRITAQCQQRLPNGPHSSTPTSDLTTVAYSTKSPSLLSEFEEQFRDADSLTGETTSENLLEVVDVQLNEDQITEETQTRLQESEKINLMIGGHDKQLITCLEGAKDAQSTAENEVESHNGGDGDVDGMEDDVACSKFGSDLLQLYRRGKDCDATLRVGNMAFQAHRCVLCARSHYFAAMLSGSWTESAASEIKLEGFSAVATETLLCYLYGGCVDVPADCSCVELAVMADMYGLDGLKHIVSYNLKRNKCHFFHKPCNGCVGGVSLTLPLAYSHGLTEVWDGCLRWSTRFYSRLWADRRFAEMPAEIRDKCAQAVIIDINNSTVLEHVMSCDRLRGGLTTVKWAQPVVAMVTRVMEAAILYIANNFARVVKSPQFRQLEKTMSISLGFWRDVFSRVVASMLPSKCCEAHMVMTGLLKDGQMEHCDWNEDFQSMLGHIDGSITAYMGRHMHQIVNTPEWNRTLSPETQKTLKEGALYISVGDSNKPRGVMPTLHKRPPVPRPRSAGAPPSSPSLSRSASTTRPRSAAHTRQPRASAQHLTTSKPPSPSMSKRASPSTSKPASTSTSQSQASVPTKGASRRPKSGSPANSSSSSSSLRGASKEKQSRPNSSSSTKSRSTTKDGKERVDGNSRKASTDNNNDQKGTHGGARPKTVRYKVETENENSRKLKGCKGLSKYSSGSLDRNRSKGSLDLSRSSELEKSQDYSSSYGSSSRELGEGSSRELGKSSSRELGKSSSRELGKSSSRELGKSSSRELGKSSSRELGKSSSRELGKSSSRELGKSNSKEATKPSSRESTKPSSRESTKSSSRESTKSSSSKQHSTYPKSFTSSKKASDSSISSTASSSMPSKSPRAVRKRYLPPTPPLPRSPRTSSHSRPSFQKSASLEEEQKPRHQQNLQRNNSARQRTPVLSRSSRTHSTASARQSHRSSATATCESLSSFLSSTKATIDSSNFTSPTLSLDSRFDFDSGGSDVFGDDVLSEEPREGCVFEERALVPYLNVTFQPAAELVI